MHKYWPRRAVPEGFAIQKLATHSSEQLPTTSLKEDPLSRENSNQPEKLKVVPRLHWANRSYNEYRGAA